MAFSDELVRASQAFKESMQDLGAQRQFQRATQQIEQIKRSDADEFQKQQLIEEQAQQLGQQLVALDQPISQVNAAMQAFAPPAPKSPELDILGGSEAFFSAETPEERQRALKRLGRGQFKKEQLAKLDITRENQKLKAKALQKEQELMQKQSKEGRKALRKRLDKFKSENKSIFESLALTSGASTMLKTSDDPIGMAFAVRSLLKLAGEERISDPDFRSAVPGGKSTLQAILRRASEEGTNPEILERDKAVLTKAIETLGKKARERLQEDARQTAKGFGKTIPTVSQGQIEEALMARIPSEESFGFKGAAKPGDILNALDTRVQDPEIKRQFEDALLNPEDPENRDLIENTIAPALGFDPKDVLGE